VTKRDLTVFVVDSDTLCRNAVQETVCKMHLRCRTYESGQRFLAEYDRSVPGCLVCEVQIPDMGGLDIQRRLAREDGPLAIVFLAAHPTVPIVVRAMCEGAVHFMKKPLREGELWEAIQKALVVDRRRRGLLADRERVKQRLGSLTRAESDVWTLWVQDNDAQAIADRLGITVRAVEHRQNTVLRKLGLRASLRLLSSISGLFDDEVRWVDESAISRDIAAFHREHGLCEPHHSRARVPCVPPQSERRSI
jgi:FixJ family two-component response regulator